MDQQQIRFNFLDEAQDCLHQVESVLLELSSTIAEPEKLDLALRATHSVKGGAGMMGFLPLSNVAHRLEDFFKILRLRHHSTQISTEVESLLLRGVDSMGNIIELHRQGTDVEDTWLKDHVDPIFEQLDQHLGKLRAGDENLLFNQSEGANAELLMFEEGVEPILDEFEDQLSEISSEQLSSALMMTAEKLLVFGRMADLEPFVQLCESIQQQAMIATTQNINSLVEEALTVWRRSHALVMRGSLDKLPSELKRHRLSSPISDGLGVDNLNLDGQNNDLLSLANALDDNVNLDLFSNEDFNFEDQFLQSDFDLLSEENIDIENLEDLQNAFAQISVAEPEKPLVSSPKIAQIPSKTGQMVRIPVEQLTQFNTLFGKLILERNRVNLRLEQLRNVTQLMQRRMSQLEQSNTQLRNWYDRTSTQDSFAVTEQSMVEIPVSSTMVNGAKSSISPEKTAQNNGTSTQFDTLEMDSYSDLHLISQGQIETIVQLKEVSTDIDLGLEDLNQAVRELNHTMRSLQKKATSIQMRPFEDLVKSFPRFIRDLSIQFNKKVNLKIEGETTLFDRTLIETLNAPLMHLLRNAFDHGIEDFETRKNAGKPPEGTITLSAINRGTQTIITVKDDGKGISVEKIGDRLMQMGITSTEIEQMSESQIIDYIFQPGFTTSEEVTELSGRGVGMDVVRTNIQEMRGNVQVQSKVGQGSTFVMTVPSNLSILRVMIVQAKGMVFAMPVNTVREILQLKPEENSTSQDLNQFTWRDQTIPVIYLENIFTFNRPSQPFEMSGNSIINQPTILVVGDQDNVGGIHIDQFWGEQEVTIRPINTHLPLPLGFISSLILGDGRILPLIEPVQILQESLKQNEQTNKDDIIPVKINQDLPFTSEKIKTILIIDDSINVRNYLATTLEKAGYRVEQAKDGREAVDKLFGGLTVEAAICDIEMPRLDGYGVLEEVKGKPEFQSLPIIMLSSRSNEKHQKLAFNLGASAYFSKPYNEQELIGKIGDLTR